MGACSKARRSRPSDRQYRALGRATGSGVYTTNGALLCVVQRSAVGKPVPDLFCYAVLADFRGYKPGYSERIRKRHDCLTWVVLKGHTNNRGGSVTITSPDPRARPAIEFRYFEEGTDAAGDDLQAVVERHQARAPDDRGHEARVDRGRGTARATR